MLVWVRTNTISKPRKVFTYQHFEYSFSHRIQTVQPEVLTKPRGHIDWANWTVYHASSKHRHAEHLYTCCHLEDVGLNCSLAENEYGAIDAYPDWELDLASHVVEGLWWDGVVNASSAIFWPCRSVRLTNNIFQLVHLVVHLAEMEYHSSDDLWPIPSVYYPMMALIVPSGQSKCERT